MSLVIFNSAASVEWYDAWGHSGTDLMLVHYPSAVEVDFGQHVHKLYPKTPDLKLTCSHVAFFVFLYVHVLVNINYWHKYQLKKLKLLSKSVTRLTVS